jgi:hypothetical protein
VELAKNSSEIQRQWFSGGTDHANKVKEFANILARLTPLANIQDVDHEPASHNKYFKNGGPKGHK